MISPFTKKQNAILLLLVSITFIIFAYTNDGYYHPDEHFQIIEFANYKLGNIALEDLAWEYQSRIRPSLQPIVCLGILKILNGISVTDPYIQSFLLRILSAFLCLIVMIFFLRKTAFFIKNKDVIPLYYTLALLLFFIPLIGVRFSSDNWSGLCFTLGIAYYMGGKSNSWVLGVIFGVSFLFRFQIAFALIGFLSWLIVINKISVANILRIITGIISIVLIGISIDSLFYGELTFTPWNYFTINIIDGVVNNFGTKPWFWYLVLFLPFTLVIAYVAIRFPKNIFVWSIIPFIFIHSFVQHKELRFLFPVAFLIPIILAIALDDILSLSGKKRKIIKRGCVFLFLTVNTLLIILTVSKSAGTARMEIPNYINDHFADSPTHLIYTINGNGFGTLKGFLPPYYVDVSNMSADLISDLSNFPDSILKPDRINLLVLERGDLRTYEDSVVIQEKAFKRLIYNIPDWMHQCLEWGAPSIAAQTKILYIQK